MLSVPVRMCDEPGWKTFFMNATRFRRHQKPVRFSRLCSHINTSLLCCVLCVLVSCEFRSRVHFFRMYVCVLCSYVGCCVGPQSVLCGVCVFHLFNRRFLLHK